MAYVETLAADAKKRYLEKVNLVRLDDCPYQIQGDAWTNNPVEWPCVEYPQVYNYLIDNPDTVKCSEPLIELIIFFFNHYYCFNLIYCCAFS